MIYVGDLLNEDQLLEWLIKMKTTDDIEEVTDGMMDKLIEETSYLAVLFCKTHTYQ